ncbi:hypothetical protein BT96DRAFT_1056801 [Gymnopus androsaceus JB14]|uniref:Uncharacterized protein n=1 Tax=Gymnopus androsaceus JB14 TaxID=1447944 RepID=A0A6A4I6V7_9AGAR|nr:hypothetical protein BT96DRAFT_1056801 [Gymnopus androsaceus JB14]
MQRWIPVLVSYSDGATAAHFELHFLVLMESIARIAQERGKSVIDFSQAEWLGFIGAFTCFWKKAGDTHTPAELREIASKLLHGCWQHFRASITRVKKIRAIVPVESRDQISISGSKFAQSTMTRI